MPFIPDVNVSSLPGDTSDDKLNSLVKQLNEWARTISNERRTEIYKDNTGINRIIIGVLPDNTTGIVISKENVDVLSVFS